ncbi:MAG: Crp/Fnr family transcriptional regulator [Bacilli bacterium]|nr:Crp/Fnr family transcriptional regulator [Bacilli bacterium]
MSQLDKIINNLEEDEIALWKKKELPKEGILFKEGEECAQVGIVVEGQLVISSYSYGGKEIVYSLIGPGAMFGNNLLYADDKRYKGNVVAKKRTTLYLIHKASLMKLLAKNPKFLEFFLSTASNKVKDLNARVRLLSFQVLEERLMFLIHESKGILPYVSITSLASELGAERETLSRLVSRLSREGTIRKEKHRLIAL